jgi:hypothetical protein
MALSPEDERKVQRSNEQMLRRTWDREPHDFFADMLELHEDSGIVRLVFRCSRPELDDPLGGINWIVSRVSMPGNLFRHIASEFEKRMAALDAPANAEGRAGSHKAS